MKHSTHFLVLLVLVQTQLFAQLEISTAATSYSVYSEDNRSPVCEGDTSPEKPVFDDGEAEMALMIAEGQAILDQRNKSEQATEDQVELPELDDGEAGMAALIAEGEKILDQR